mmetsp:Transcript_6453/g.7379  ORF Transcript_6453/g.7379 Transcript_6453/m.7379 type:complete len:206 (+) Transcript_6453:98-715(+)|eukprot:CAMPEP_0184005872 /NCGR_PEP_ID=MMETSP0954-20121128/325_1 /TAXON_ID=627963 /ORGANISM="Aplanochytrium sp, Strain PBS07" /LENGTH=205 /DNA_ID=CAMNT_0026284251 /DNA_START=106 /DNA_END=723 /DNA_ORIENTATION=-
MARDNVVFMRGSFDPPTLGHQALLLAVLEKFDSRECILIINDYKGHGKRFRAPSSVRERMLRTLLIGNEVKIKVLVATDTNRIDYNQVKAKMYPKSCLIMATGYDVLIPWRKYIGYIDKICVADRECDESVAGEPPSKFIADINADFPLPNEDRVELVHLGPELHSCSSSLAREKLAAKKYEELSNVLTPEVLQMCQESKYYDKG